MDCRCVHILRFFSVASDGATTERQIQNRVYWSISCTLRKDSVASYVRIWRLISLFVRGPGVLCNALNISQIRLQMAPQDSKIAMEILQSVNNRTQSLRKILCMVITDIVINTLLGRVTLDPAGMHCPAGDDAFVSSWPFFTSLIKYSFANYGQILTLFPQSVRGLDVLYNALNVSYFR